MIRSLGRGAALGGLAVWMIAVPPAVAQDSALVDRMNRLERSLDALTRMVARGEAAPVAAPGDAAPPMAAGPVAARLSLRIQALERDMQVLTGRVEEFTHHLDQVTRQLEKIDSDIGFRLSALESRATRVADAAPSGGTDATPPADPAPGPQTLGSVPREDVTAMQKAAQAVRAAPVEAPSDATPAAAGVTLPEGAPKAQYDFAYDLLKRRDYGQAESALQAFIGVHEGTGEPLLSNAYYWLGETYYVRSDFVSAARTFLTGYQKHGDGLKAPDSLLKLGMSLANLGKPNEACATLDKVLSDHPEAPVPVRRLAEAERRRTSCP